MKNLDSLYIEMMKAVLKQPKDFQRVVLKNAAAWIVTREEYSPAADLLELNAAYEVLYASFYNLEGGQ